MDVIFRDMTTKYLYLVGITDFPYQITDAYPDTTGENGFMVLRRPDQVVFAVKDGMACLSI